MPSQCSQDYLRAKHPRRGHIARIRLPSRRHWAGDYRRGGPGGQRAFRAFRIVHGRYLSREEGIGLDH